MISTAALQLFISKVYLLRILIKQLIMINLESSLAIHYSKRLGKIRKLKKNHALGFKWGGEEGGKGGDEKKDRERVRGR